MAEQSATALLYQTDSYVSEFTALVVSVDQGTRSVILDQTAFYPGGGGQPCDTGSLGFDSMTSAVVDVRKARAQVLHILVEGAEFPETHSTVTGRVDWEHRYQLMRTHTALHVLCGVVFRDYGASVTGGNMTPDHARMDFEMDSADFTPERVAEIVSRANAEIASNRDIRVQILQRDEAFAIPDLIRTKINLLPPGISEVRTVEIVGLDLQADGGTHVANTREVGGLQVTGTRSKGKSNKRLELALTNSPTSA